MTGLRVAALFLAGLSWGCGKKPEPPVREPLQPATSSKFHAGEEYSFDGRPSDPKPRCTVLQVDMHPKLGNIVHLALNGIRIKNDQAPGGFSEQVQHFPCAEAALEKSHLKLLKSGVPLLDFKDAYEKWKRPFEEGKAGVWTDSLAECLQAMERRVGLKYETPKK
ncbi:MAG TPA: hypothetical protein VEN81_00155 [Planctomycetota bacterium]|nr:hypothetical protein [Planctomycetota bacterium]